MMDYVKVVAVIVEGEFDIAVEHFKSNPGASNWLALERAMKAMQQWTHIGIKGREDLASANVGIGGFSALLVRQFDARAKINLGPEA